MDTSHYIRFCIAMLVSGLLIYGDLSLKLFDEARNSVSLVLVPFRAVAGFPADAYQTTVNYVTSRRGLLAEKAAVEEARQRDLVRLQSLDFYVRQNDEMRRLLGVSERVPGDWLTASVLRNIAQPLSGRLYLDKGVAAGVTAGMVAVDGRGVIGQVVRVDANTSVVNMITSVNQWLPARIQRNNLLVVLRGDGGGELTMEYVPNDMDLAVGDVLVADGELFPRGYPIAAVEQVVPGEIYMSVTARPFSRFLDNFFALLYVPGSGGEAAAQ